MSEHRRTHAAVLAAICAVPLLGQVPYGDHIATVWRNWPPTTGGGMFLVGRDGSCTPVTGLAQARGNVDVSAVQLDPITDEVWISGVRGDAGKLEKITLDPTGRVVSALPWGWATPTGSATNAYTIAGITFDDNRNPVVAAGDRIWRFNRQQAGNPTVIATLPTVTLPSCICRDPAGNLYIGSVGANGDIFEMTKRVDGSYTAPSLLGAIRPAAGNPVLWGLDYCPGSPPQLYWITAASASGSHVGRFPLPAGPAVAASPEALPGGTWIEYDVRHDDFMITSLSVNPDRVIRMDRAFGTTVHCLIPPAGRNETPAGIATCNIPDAGLVVAPMHGARGTTFDLELGTSCPPGHQAAIFLISPVPVLLAQATAGRSGRLSVRFSRLTLTSSHPLRSMTFVAAYRNPGTGRVQVGAPVQWPAQ